MDNESIQQSRDRVRNNLGSEFEAKASDAVCLALAHPAAGAGLEAALGAPPTLRAVVEFEIDTGPAPTLSETLSRIRERPGLEDALEGVRSIVRESPDPRVVERSEALANATTLLRDIAVRSSREHFYEAIGEVRDELERSVTTLFAIRSEAMSGPDLAPSPTQVCWLNQTLRTWTDPRALAGIAADPRLRQIDLPRRLEAEVGTTGNTVGVIAFRDGTGRTGKGIIVAVLDQEVARTHDAFGIRVVHRRNYTQEPWGHPGPHGTAVAGIIAADGKLQGMAPGVTIHNYKVLATNPFLNADDFAGALAIQNALEDGAHIANCSWGAGPAGDGTSREARACDTAWAHGMVVVKSAGNRGPGDSTLTTPADADGVIAVGATDREGSGVQDYSSRGTPNGRRPHLVAPGGTPARGVDSCRIIGGFGDCGHGTSFAAPHVTGLLALLLEEQPGLTPDQLRSKLLGFCTPFPNVPDHVQGAGLVVITQAGTSAPVGGQLPGEVQ